MSDVGEVKIKFEGDASGLSREFQKTTDEMVSFVRNAIRLIGDAGTLTANQLSTVERSFKGAFDSSAPFADAMAQATSRAGAEVEKLGGRAQTTERSVGSLGGTLATTAKHAGTLILALAGYRGITALAKDIENLVLFNSQMEQARLGIAATITTAGQFVDPFGKALPFAQQMAIALREGDTVTKQLLTDSIRLGLPVDALIHGYSLVAGSAKAAGIDSAQLVKITEGLTILGDRLHIPYSIMARDIRDVVTGMNVQRTVLGIALGLTQEQVKTAREHGQLADLLIGKLSGPLQVAEEQNLHTWRGITTAIEDSTKALSIEASNSSFGLLEGAAKELLDMLEQVRKDPEKLAAIRQDIEIITTDLIKLTEGAGWVIKLIFDTNQLPGPLRDAIVGGTVGGYLGGVPGVVAGAAINVAGGALWRGGGYLAELEAEQRANDKRNAMGPPQPIMAHAHYEPSAAEAAGFQASGGEAQEQIKKGAAILAKGSIAAAHAELEAAAKEAGLHPNQANIAAYTEAANVLDASRRAKIDEQVKKEFPALSPNVDPALVAQRQQQQADRKKQLTDEVDAQHRSDLDRVQSFEKSERQKTDALRASSQARVNIELEASRKMAEAAQRTANLQIQLAQERGKAEDLLDHRPSARIARSNEVYAIQVKELEAERLQLAAVTEAASRAVTQASGGLGQGTPLEQNKAAEAFDKAASAWGVATQRENDFHITAAIALQKHKNEVIGLKDEYLHLGEVFSSTTSNVLKGFAFGTLDVKNAGKAIGESFFGAVIDATVQKKLAEFDPIIKKNLLEYLPSIAGEGGRATGTGFIGGALNAIKGLFGGSNISGTSTTGTGSGILPAGINLEQVAGQNLSSSSWLTGIFGSSTGAATITAENAPGAMSTIGGGAMSMMPAATAGGTGAAGAAGAASMAGGIATAGVVLSIQGIMAALADKSGRLMRESVLGGAPLIGLAQVLHLGPNATNNLLMAGTGGTSLLSDKLFNAMGWFQGPSQDTLNAQAIKRSYIQTGMYIPNSAYTAGFNPDVPGQPGIRSRDTSNAAYAAGILGFGSNAMGTVGRFQSDFTNIEASLGLTVKQAYEQLRDFLAGAGINDLGTALHTLNEKVLDGTIAWQSLQGSIDPLTHIFNADLPTGIDTTIMAANNMIATLDGTGQKILDVTQFMKDLTQQQQFFSQDVSATLVSLMNNVNVSQAGATLAGNFVTTFEDRLVADILTTTATGGKISTALAEADQAAADFALGTPAGKAAGQALLAQARSDLQAGWQQAQTVINGLGLNNIGASFGAGSISGMVDQGNLASQFSTTVGPSTTGRTTSTRSASFASGPALGSASEVVPLLKQLVAAVNTGALTIDLHNNLEVTSVLDGREIARSLQRTTLRGRTPGVALARLKGIKGGKP